MMRAIETQLCEKSAAEVEDMEVFNCMPRRWEADAGKVNGDFPVSGTGISPVQNGEIPVSFELGISHLWQDCLKLFIT